MKALDIVLILHADHEMNCSTAALRHLSSSGVDACTAIAGATGMDGWMDVCLYVCIMYLCIYLCMYVCMYVGMYVCMYVCMYVYMCRCFVWAFTWGGDRGRLKNA